MKTSIHPSMALQPLPGLGLPHKTPPFISIRSSSPPSSYPQQLSIPFPFTQFVVYLLIPSEASLRFSEHRFFFSGWVRTPTPNPQPGGPGCPFLSGSSPLTCPAWVTYEDLIPYNSSHISNVALNTSTCLNETLNTSTCLNETRSR